MKSNLQKIRSRPKHFRADPLSVVPQRRVRRLLPRDQGRDADPRHNGAVSLIDLVKLGIAESTRLAEENPMPQIAEVRS
jgi:hypothetical protein